jgi:hypothetical protein
VEWPMWYGIRISQVRDFESETYPLIKLGEEDNRKFQYWCERFFKTYNNKIGSRTVYILH